MKRGYVPLAKRPEAVGAQWCFARVFCIHKSGLPGISPNLSLFVVVDAVATFLEVVGHCTATGIN